MNGIHSVGKAVYIIVPMPFIILLVLGIRGLTLPGAMQGWAYFLKPNFAKLGTIKIWKDALSQVIFSEDLVMRPVIYQATYRKSDEPLKKPCIWIPVIDTVTALFSSLVLFTFVGYMSS